ncbi:MAG: O-antigen ligase family protein [Planctomycetota bacterium]|nr:O-antigen ligase family protein [Planctomycetota bacterium]
MPEPAAPDRRAERAGAFLLATGVFWGLFVVFRLAAQPQEPYGLEAGLAGLMALLFALFAYALTAVTGRRGLFPDLPVLALGVLGVGLLLLGFVRSPFYGRAFARLGDAGTGMLLLLAVHVLARFRRGLEAPLLAAMAAMGAAEACAGLWQRFVTLPRLRALVESGQVELPPSLQGLAGSYSLHSNEIFGSLGNANSLAAFLLLAVFAALALAWGRPAAEPLRRTGRGLACAAACTLMILTICLTGSKGGWAALTLGAGFLALQSWARTSGQRRAALLLAAAGGLLAAAALALCAAGTFGDAPLGASMFERFGYWRAGARMIADEPVLGLGLGAFRDAYSIYKVPLGTEVQEAHNDWLQLWAELGILAPLTWAALWCLAFRSPAEAAASPEDGAPADGALKPGRLAAGILLGAVLAHLMLWAVSDQFDAGYVREFLAPLDDAGRAPVVAWGAAGAVLSFLAFLGCWWALRPGASRPPGPVFVFCVRAGAGALLAHQVVDFDHAVPALLAALFVLAGILLARRPARDSAGLERWPRALMPVAAAVLFPVCALVPLYSGLSRQVAEIEEEAWRRLARDAARPEAREELRARQERAALLWEEAWAWAPFDGVAAEQTARAYLALRSSGRQTWPPHGGATLDEPLLAALAEAEALRPWYAGLPLLRGHDALQRGFEELEARRALEAAAWFVKAEAHYRRAAALYPLAPVFRILAGDARLLQGDAAGAAAAYLEAWAVDARIRDRNQYLLALFTDARPGCAPQHGREAEIAARLRELLKRSAARGDLAAGLRVRELLSRGVERRRLRESAVPAGELRRAGREFLAACEALAAERPGDAHAALFRAFAAALHARNDPAAVAAARRLAEETRARALGAGRPAVPEDVFMEFAARMDALAQPAAP